jgi:release factor glutamine methyltransferase
MRTTGHALQRAIRRMQRYDIPEAEQSARLLISAAMGQRNLPEKNQIMTSEQIDRFDEYCDLRITRRTPVQYIIGEWDFYNLVGLKMRPPVLIPRPETEELVDYAIKIVDSRKRLRILDPCSGSGAIGLALLRHFPDATCLACDVNKDAVDLATYNASLMGMSSRYECLKSCVSELVLEDDEFDLVVCNPPYILTSDMNSLAPEVINHEDPLALHGGKDGYDVTRNVLSSTAHYLRPGAQVLLELDSSQPEHFETWWLSSSIHDSTLQFVEWRRDFSSLPRFVRLGKVV